jgi:hypothetical protein
MRVRACRLKKYTYRSMDNYVRFLRRNVAPTMIQLQSSGEIRSLENMLYAQTFKGQVMRRFSLDRMVQEFESLYLQTESKSL